MAMLVLGRVVTRSISIPKLQAMSSQHHPVLKPLGTPTTLVQEMCNISMASSFLVMKKRVMMNYQPKRHAIFKGERA